MVFGLPFGRFNPVVVGLLNATTDGWPLVGSEEMDIDHSPLANELRTAYITNSKIYDAGKITAEQFRAAVCPLFDRITNKRSGKKWTNLRRNSYRVQFSRREYGRETCCGFKRRTAFRSYR